MTKAKMPPKNLTTPGLTSQTPARESRQAEKVQKVQVGTALFDKNEFNKLERRNVSTNFDSLKNAKKAVLAFYADVDGEAAKNPQFHRDVATILESALADPDAMKQLVATAKRTFPTADRQDVEDLHGHLADLAQSKA